MVLVSKSWILTIPIPFLRAVVDEENIEARETANGQDGKVTKFQYFLAGHSGQVFSLCPPVVSEDLGSNLTMDSCVYCSGYCNMQPWEWAAPYCSA